MRGRKRLRKKNRQRIEAFAARFLDPAEWRKLAWVMSEGFKALQCCIDEFVAAGQELIKGQGAFLLGRQRCHRRRKCGS